MSKSFAIRGGDIVVGNGRAYGVVDGQDKLLQDLKLWIMERVGNDPATPTFGSRFDGGIENGRYVEAIVGGFMSEEALNDVRMHLRELIHRYRQLQLEKAQQEISRFGETTIKNTEMISRIKHMNVMIVGDVIAAKVTLTTLAGQDLKLIVPFLI